MIATRGKKRSALFGRSVVAPVNFVKMRERFVIFYKGLEHKIISGFCEFFDYCNASTQISLQALRTPPSLLNCHSHSFLLLLCLFWGGWEEGKPCTALFTLAPRSY
mmetsp:Transcript_28336/g.64812  ORF Transcript_28336/g.64812 Transcript_28336/m.64812 type:complete len:106 (+) Transcript_28336:1335-1652(+)